MAEKRRKSDPNVYFFTELETYLMVYVDDVVIMGHYPEKLSTKIQEQVLLRLTQES